MTCRVLLAGVAVVALLGACDRKPDTPPARVDAAPAAPVVLAPATPESLPAAPPARVVVAAPDRADDYWTQAEADDRYYDDRPPSYAYDYADEAPAVWLEGEMVRRVVERLAGGGERTYYYRAGQDRPYYVQDPYYGYGYDNGALATVYDVRQRRALDREATRARADEAGRYLARSQALRRTALQASRQDRRPLDAGQWRAWRTRQDEPARPPRPADPAPPPAILAPPQPVPAAPDSRPGRPDRGQDGRPPVATPPPAPILTPVPRPIAPDAALEPERETPRRPGRLPGDAELKARRDAAAGKLRPPQTPTPPVAERRKPDPSTAEARPERAYGDAEAARAKAADDAAHPKDHPL